ncbi:LuxR C-terminal-related transcriptional regulator [Oceanicola sp. 22II-s10i]|uniref:helix-turn-helix transcriptional regulator n=1 Tax=Oceanicola sp. 22II-s10i TaxID=1317116 RepID=UPI000B524966|nr:LuxR C-terminal-related transcriptional regulator [Oceanicola sp. 22II-s10i]
MLDRACTGPDISTNGHPTSLTSIAMNVQLVGTPSFAEGLYHSVCSVFDADACRLLFLDRGDILVAGQSGHQDLFGTRPEFTPMTLRMLLRDARTDGTVVSISGEDAPRGYDLNRHQRVIIAGSAGSLLSAIHILRDDTRLELRPDQIANLRQLSPLLHSLASRHIELAHKRQQSVAPLETLDQIEAFVAGTNLLTPREGQVCARILYGMSTCGISLDLEIGKESVFTYRKRAYRRLCISSQRELMMWYLDAYDRELSRAAA